MVQYNVNVKQAHATMAKNKIPITAIKIGKTNLDYESTITGDTRLPGWTTGYLKGYVGDQASSKSDEPRVSFKVGDAINTETVKKCNFKGDDCWAVRTHPRIDKLNRNKGKIDGG